MAEQSLRVVIISTWSDDFTFHPIIKLSQQQQQQQQQQED
jgi:hypothetical protein